MQPVALLTDTGCRRSLISYPESLVISAGASRRRQATVFPQAVSGCSRCCAQDGATAAKGASASSTPSSCSPEATPGCPPGPDQLPAPDPLQADSPLVPGEPERHPRG